MSGRGETNGPRAPALAAAGAGLAMIACCALAPLLIGAAWGLALGGIEAALVAAALGFGVVALRRQRAGRSCDPCGRGEAGD